MLVPAVENEICVHAALFDSKDTLINFTNLFSFAESQESLCTCFSYK